jgi:hypothetical protein
MSWWDTESREDQARRIRQQDDILAGWAARRATGEAPEPPRSHPRRKAKAVGRGVSSRARGQGGAKTEAR